jgi:hypothetical protein
MMMPLFNKHRTLKFYKISKIAFIFTAITITLFIAGAVHTVEMPLDKTPYQSTLSKKIETYKKFKAKYEDKDFQLNSYPVSRTKHIKGELKSFSFNVYHITYGIIADNIKEYGKRRKQIVQNPTIRQAVMALDCQSSRYVEDYSESRLHPEITCTETAAHSYSVSLVLKTLSEEELNHIAVIYEFNDGDLDIQFALDIGSNKELVERLSAKLKDADEKNDAQRQAVKMEPIMPTPNQRVSVSYLDENEDGESDFVLIPYCINGSYFDEDPGNNSIQVALKYKLVTRLDLVGKTPEERKVLAKRIGLWMWDRPSEILTSFTNHPGPDIVFYDIGKVVNSEIVDPMPDGNFDRYKFLY